MQISIREPIIDLIKLIDPVLWRVATQRPVLILSRTGWPLSAQHRCAE